MWTSLADLLVSEGAPEDPREDGLVVECLESLVQAVHQAVEELEGVVLLAQVYLLALQSARVGQIKV